ncbi:MAG: phage baseplate assembly protein V, partial [Armatimonadota bacterium]
MLEFQDEQHEERYKDKWYGKYRAFVRDNHDPERFGRLKLEIPAVLGVGEENWSDWAWPCFPYGGNDDIGMFLVPEEGASVWAEFEGGDPQYPIWTGVWLAKSNPGEQSEEAKRLCSSTTCLDCEDKYEHASDAADSKEHGKFHGHPPYYCPRRKALIKTETGHTIVMDDRDEEEFLKIIDRAGQILHMHCPVKREVQVANSRRRGTHDFASSEGDSQAGAGSRSQQIDIARDIKGRKAFVQVTDA